MRRFRLLTLLLAAIALCAWMQSAAFGRSAGGPRWPFKQLQIGLADPSGGAAALHVDATDTRALAQALGAVARSTENGSPENFEGLRSRALARAAEFSWQRTARLTREVYVEAQGVFHAR